jgi:hypothetical protein
MFASVGVGNELPFAWQFSSKPAGSDQRIHVKVRHLVHHADWWGEDTLLPGPCGSPTRADCGDLATAVVDAGMSLGVCTSH